MRFTTQIKKIFSPSAKGDRKTGYYWVRWCYQGNKWRVAFYHNEAGIWYLPGDTRSYYDNDFIAINESRIQMFHSKYWWLTFWITVGMTVINLVLTIFYHINNITK